MILGSDMDASIYFYEKIDFDEELNPIDGKEGDGIKQQMINMILDMQCYLSFMAQSIFRVEFVQK